MNLNNRRKILINKMNELIAAGKDCFSCSGMCCTYEFNSMKITSEEAQEIKSHLIEQGKWNLELKENLLKNVAEFRLDNVIFMKSGKSIRRTYTCPFYAGKNLGCALTAEVKPLGCLAFNPKEKKVNVPGLCGVFEGGSGLDTTEGKTIPEAILNIFD